MRWSSHPPLLEREVTEDALRLPRPGFAPTRSTFDALRGAAPGSTPPPRSAGIVGTLLAYSYGLVGALRYPQGALPRRPAPSAGGLYPCTLVVATMGAGELEAGLYAFAPVEHALVPIRLGAAAAWRARAAAGAEDGAIDPVFILVASYWRSAWKYQLRALRYCAQDAGHAAGAILAAAGGLDAPAKVLRISEPATLAELLGLDPAAAGVMGAVGVELLGAEVSPAPASASVGSLVRPAAEGQAVSGVMLEAAQRAAGAPASSGLPLPPPSPEGEATPLPAAETHADDLPLADCVIRRHSVRHYRRDGISLARLSLLLETAACREGDLVCGLAARSVYGLEPGIYRHAGETHSLHPLRPGRVADELAAAALGQTFVGQAAICLMPIADLEATCVEGGPRAFLDAFFQVGVSGQRLYLAATALGLGACAVGAYNDAEVNMLAGLERDHEAVLCLLPVGVPRAS